MVGQRTVVRLPKQLADQMIAHAREQWPKEACGVVGGRDGAPTRVRRAQNVDPRPEIRYLISSPEVLAIYNELDQRGEELYGIYHSHARTEAYPSPTDVRLAGHPGAIYFLVSLQDREHPVLRAFDINQEQRQREWTAPDDVPISDEERRIYHKWITELPVEVV